MRTKRNLPGSVVKIPYDEHFHTYGIVLRNLSLAVYDCTSNLEIDNLEEIAAKPILFILAVYDWPIRKGRWKKIGELPQIAQKIAVPNKYIQEIGFPEQCLIVDEKYNKTPATVEECIGLEKVSVWDAEHVEERLRDHYAGRKNRYLERDRLALEAARKK